MKREQLFTRVGVRPHRTHAEGVPTRDLRLYALVLGAFLLRMINLEGRPVWYDEAFAILYAAKPFATMWYGTVTQVSGAAADVHPLFFYSLLHLWMGLVGESALAVRFLSVGFGVLTIPVLYRLARILFNQTTARAALFVLTVSPFHIAYSQEARMYAQLGFFSALALLAFFEFEKTRARRWWLLFVTSGTAALYSHNLGFLVFAALGVWVVARTIVRHEFRLLRATVLAGGAMLVLWSPWLLLLPSQFGKIVQAYWVTRPDAVSLLQTLLGFAVGFDNAQLPPFLLPPALFAALFVVILAAFQFFRAGRNRPGAGVALTLTLIPPLALFLVSQWRPLYITRALMASFLMLVIFFAWTVTRTPPRVRALVGIGLTAVIVMSLAFYYQYAEFPRPPFREATAFLSAQVSNGDAIVHDNKLSYFPTYYYAPTLHEAFVADPVGAGSDTLALPTQQALQLFATSLDAATQGHARVWFVMFREAQNQSDHPANLEWLNEHYRELHMVSFNDLDIYLYEK